MSPISHLRTLESQKGEALYTAMGRRLDDTRPFRPTGISGPHLRHAYPLGPSRLPAEA